MSTSLSIHNVSSINVERHLFDGFLNLDLIICTSDGAELKVVIYSKSDDLQIRESARIEDHRREAA